jgi:cytochrome c biogenesis protein CcmG, thiol:disulfide interchange protein DsbE
MSKASPTVSRRAAVFVPLAVAGAGGLAAWRLLGRMQSGTYDPRALPSVLVGRKVPYFDLPALLATPFYAEAAATRLTSRQVLAAARPALLNFFASWCAPCAEEALVLEELKSQGIPIYGIAYKDEATAAKRFLKGNGDPYVRVGADKLGTMAIEFGLYGVPETYALDGDGVVRRRWVGAVTTDMARNSVLPLLRSLR